MQRAVKVPSEWFYKLMGEEIGPVSGAELREHALDGRVTRESHLRRRDDERWIIADSVKGLFDTPPLRTAKAANHEPTPMATSLPPDAPISPNGSAQTSASSSKEFTESRDPAHKAAANPNHGFLGVVAAGLFLVLLFVQCSSDNPASLTTEEQRASEVFQDGLGADRDTADRAARTLNQMLERDRRRGR